MGVTPTGGCMGTGLCFFLTGPRFLLGRHKLAIEAYRQAEVRSEKSDWEIYHNLGVCLMYLKEYDEARDELTKALNYHKNDQSFMMLAKIHLLQGDVDGAIEIYKMAVAFSPENPDLNSTLGLLYMQTNQHAMALEHLGTAMAFDPTFAKAILAAGSMMQPNRGQTFMLLAIALVHLEDPENAKSAYDQAAQLDAKDPAIPLNLAILHFNGKELQEAGAQLKQFEARVDTLRKSGMDADPDVLATAGGLASKMGYSLGVEVPPQPLRASLNSATPPEAVEPKKSARQPSASVKSARASAKATMKAEGLKRHDNQDPDLITILDPPHDVSAEASEG
eukprot:maker-scaffold96_size378025-snap-gene-2.34 protein:Tk04978 transcript:maker-scaffold96_size378025-snap-gene-2.34-mRNA-1 annotation:"bardet-biedl syndrome 4"